MAALLAEKVPVHRSCVRSGKGEGEGVDRSPLPNGADKGGVHHVHQSHHDFLPHNAHLIYNMKTQAYNLHILVFSELCEMANKNR